MKYNINLTLGEEDYELLLDTLKDHADYVNGIYNLLYNRIIELRERIFMASTIIEDEPNIEGIPKPVKTKVHIELKE